MPFPPLIPAPQISFTPPTPRSPRSFDLELRRFRRIFPPKPRQWFIPGNHDIGHHSKCLLRSAAAAAAPHTSSRPPLIPDAILSRFEREFGPSAAWHRVSDHHCIVSVNPAALGAEDCEHGQADFWQDINRMSVELSSACPPLSCSRTLLVHYPLGRPLHSKCTAGHFFGQHGTYTGYPWLQVRP